MQEDVHRTPLSPSPSEHPIVSYSPPRTPVEAPSVEVILRTTALDGNLALREQDNSFFAETFEDIVMFSSVLTDQEGAVFMTEEGHVFTEREFLERLDDNSVAGVPIVLFATFPIQSVEDVLSTTLPSEEDAGLEEYLSSNPDIRPYLSHIHPLLSTQQGLPPYTVLSDAFIEDSTSMESRKEATVHLNNMKMEDLGLGKEGIDLRFLRGKKPFTTNGNRLGVERDERRMMREYDKEQRELRKEEARIEKEALKMRKRAEREAKKQGEARRKEDARQERLEEKEKTKEGKKDSKRAREEERERMREEKRAGKKRVRTESGAPSSSSNADIPSLSFPEEGGEALSLEEEASPYEKCISDYEKSPWARNPIPKDGKLLGEDGAPILWSMLPESIVNALQPFIFEKLLKGEEDTLGEDIFKHVARYEGRNANKSFQGWRLTMSVRKGLPSQQIARTEESFLCAIICAAAYVDDRICAQASAHSWVLWLVEKGEEAARRWLSDSDEVLKRWRDIPVSSRGQGRKKNAKAAVRDAAFLASGYVHNPTIGTRVSHYLHERRGGEGREGILGGGEEGASSSLLPLTPSNAGEDTSSFEIPDYTTGGGRNLSPILGDGDLDEEIENFY